MTLEHQVSLNPTGHLRNLDVIELCEGGVIDDEVLFSEKWAYF